MRSFLSTVTRFLNSDDGPTATEYAVMLALIIIACVATISLIGDGLNTTFGNVATAIAGL